MLLYLLSTSNLFANDNLKILLAGDTMLGNKQYYLQPKLFGASLLQLSQSYDFIFFNFEGTVGVRNRDDKSPKCLKGIFCYTFMSPPETVDLFNNIKAPDTKLIFNVANNHSKDYGELVQQQTYDLLSKNNYPIGYIKYPFKEFNIKNTKVVFIGASPHQGSLSIFNNELFQLVQKFKKQNYIVLVSLHMGAEGNEKYIVKDNDEIFAYQNRGNIYKLAHQLIDNGADVIIGHGPHVIRGIENYKSKPIFYSLGNFLTYGTFSLEENTAMSLLVEINLNKDGNLIAGKLFGYEQTKTIAPNLWNNGIAIRENSNTTTWLINLSKKNFKNTFNFNENGDFK